MKNISLLLIFTLFIQSSISFSQETDTQDDYSPIKTISSDKKKYFLAEIYVDNGNFQKALRLYKELLSNDEDNANLNFKIGFCYLNIVAEKLESISYLEKAIKNVSDDYAPESFKEKNAPVEALFFLGKAYHLNYQFQDAIGIFQDLISRLPDYDTEFINKINREIQMCKNGIELVKNPVNMVINNLSDTINSKFSEHSPVFSADESVLIFTSNRKGSTGGKLTLEGNYFEDIYISYKENGEWTTPQSIGDSINTANHEATIGLSVDGQQLFIYKDEFNNGDGNIFHSKLDGDVWSVPKKLGTTVNTKARETHASLSADGNTLYFTSERKGGYGGLDIYKVKMLPNGQWGLAQNLGQTINTPYNEEGQYIHPDGVTLFFSSEGHNSMGGFDIFSTSVNEDGTYTEPTNIGYPINTTDDDVFYVPTPDGKRAYYSSFQAGGIGQTDIYLITLPESEEKALTVMSGVITLGSGEPSQDITITITDAETDELIGVYTPNSKTGKFLFILTTGRNYNVLYEAEDRELSYTETLNVPKESAYEEVHRAIELNPVIVGEDDISTALTLLKGVVKDAVLLKPIAATIEVIDNEKNELISTSHSNSKTGKYLVSLPSGKNYGLVIKADGYLFHSENFNVIYSTTYQEITKDILLNKISVGSKIILNNIFFDYSKATLRPESYAELNRILKFFTDYPKIRIEISGHTDNQGSLETNITLSANRAKAVVDYLTALGVDVNRLEYKGFAFSQSIATNDTEEGRQLNRRVEFKIIK